VLLCGNVKKLLLYIFYISEYLSLNKILAYLESINSFILLNFSDNSSSSVKSASFGFIDNIRFQGKFSSLPRKSTNSYTIKLEKSTGKLNGKNIKRNYSADDLFEYLIIGLSGTHQDPTKYYNMFYYIPKSYLIKEGYLRSENCEGRCSISIVPEEFMNNHWSSQFLNVFQPTPQIIKKPTLRLL